MWETFLYDPFYISKISNIFILDPFEWILSLIRLLFMDIWLFPLYYKSSWGVILVTGK